MRRSNVERGEVCCSDFLGAIGSATHVVFSQRLLREWFILMQQR